MKVAATSLSRCINYLYYYTATMAISIECFSIHDTGPRQGPESLREDTVVRVVVPTNIHHSGGVPARLS